MQQIYPGEVFANTSDFDEGIRQLLPRYSEMLDVITNCIPSTSCQILELGCGTGELSFKILNRFPQARITALDYSPRMLQYAEGKIVNAGFSHRWRGIQADFGEWANKPEKFAIDVKFDACVSSLAIHHLTDEMKQNLFTTVRKNLNSNGCFWNADPVLGESPALAEIYQNAREEWANQQGKNLAEVRAKVAKSNTYGYSSQDQLASLEHHLQMLNIAGFNVIAVPWKYYGLAVFGGFCNS